MSTPKATIRNWREFQHYSDRNPPWIKLHREILQSEDWVMWDDASRLLAIMCMLVAARTEGGEVPLSPEYIKRVTYLDQEPDLGPLVDSGFLVTDEYTPPAKPKKKPANPKPKSKQFKPPTRGEVMEYISEKELGLVDADEFLTFYGSKGWMVGKNKMKDWKLAITGWNTRAKSDRTSKQKRPSQNIGANSRKGTYHDF